MLANGRGAYLDPGETLAGELFLVAAELDGDRRNARIYRAAASRMDILLEQFADQIHRVEIVEWDPHSRIVAARCDLKLDALTLRSDPLAFPDAQQILRQQVFVVFVDQDVACVQFQPVVFAEREDAALGFARNEKQSI